QKSMVGQIGATEYSKTNSQHLRYSHLKLKYLWLVFVCPSKVQELFDARTICVFNCRCDGKEQTDGPTGKECHARDHLTAEYDDFITK
ncbi:hypothetical protein ABEB36_013148, partial [Hypothenemus hampei]